MRPGVIDNLSPMIDTVTIKKFEIPIITLNPPLTTIDININPFFRVSASSLD
jgi:hypothetical protein